MSSVEKLKRTIHLFSLFPFSRMVAYASSFGFRSDMINASNNIELVQWCLSQPCIDNLNFTVILACFFYSIWSLRNKKLFEGHINVALVVEKWESMVQEFLDSPVAAVSATPLASSEVVSIWAPPREGRLGINIDAAWIKGERAVAMIVRDCSGRLLLVASSRRPCSGQCQLPLPGNGLMWNGAVMQNSWSTVPLPIVSQSHGTLGMTTFSYEDFSLTTDGRWFG